jgi:hypothetical protein
MALDMEKLPADDRRRSDGLHESLRSDHPLRDETFASIAAALESIAEELEAMEGTA